MDTEETEKETLDAIEAIDDIFALLPADKREKAYHGFHKLTKMALRIRKLLRHIAVLALEILAFRRTVRKLEKELAVQITEIDKLKKGAKNA